MKKYYYSTWIVAFLLSFQVNAALKTFLPASGNWNVNANWSGGFVPLAGDDVVIPAGRICTINTLAVSALSVTVQGTLTNNTGGSLNISGYLMNDDGTIDFNGASKYTINLTGTGDVIRSGGTPTWSLYRLNVNGAGNAFISSTGSQINVFNRLQVAAGKTFDLRSSTLISWDSTIVNGTITDTESGGLSQFVGVVKVNPGGLFTNTLTFITNFWINRGIINNGTTYLPHVILAGYPSEQTVLSGSRKIVIDNARIDGEFFGSYNAIVTNNDSLEITNSIVGDADIGFTENLTNLGVLLYGGTTNFLVAASESVTLNANTTNFLVYNRAGDQTAWAKAGVRNLRMTNGGVKAQSGGMTVGQNLIIDAGTTYNVGTQNVAVNGTTTVSGTFSDNSNLGLTALTGLVTVNSGGVFNATAVTTNSQLRFRGGITNNCGVAGSFEMNGCFFETNNQSINGSSPILVQGMTVSSNITLTNFTTLNVRNSIVNNGTGQLLVNRGTLRYGGINDFGVPVDFSTFVPNRVVYDRNGNQNVYPYTYQELRVDSGGVKIPTADITTNFLRIEAGATFNASDFNITSPGVAVYGTFLDDSNIGVNTFGDTRLYSPVGSWNTTAVMNAANMIFTFGLRLGSLPNGTFQAGSATFVTNDQIIQAGHANFLGTVIVSGVQLTINSNAILNVRNSINGAGTGASLINQGEIRYGGATQPMIIGAIDCNSSPNLIVYNRNGNQNIRNTTYQNIVLDSSGVKTLVGGTTVNSSVEVKNNVTLSLLGFAFTVNGKTYVRGALLDDNNIGANVFVDSVVVFNGGTWNTVAITAQNNCIFRGSIKNNGLFNAGAGSFRTNTKGVSGTRKVMFNGNVIMADAITVTNFDSLDIRGNLTRTVVAPNATFVNNGVFIYGGTSVPLSDGGVLDFDNIGNTVIYNSDAASQSVAGTTYHHLIIDKPGTNTNDVEKVPAGDVSVNGNFRISRSSTSPTSGKSSFFREDFDFVVNGTTTINNGCLFFDGTPDNPIIFRGLVTVANGGEFNGANRFVDGFMFFENGITNNGTFTAGYIRMTNNSQAISGSQPLVFTGIRLDNNITVTNNAKVRVNVILTSLALGCTWINNDTLVYNGAGNLMPIGNFDASPTDNTVMYVRNDFDQPIRGGTYYHLVIENQSNNNLIKVLQGAAVVAGQTVINMIGTGTLVFNLFVHGFTANGTVDISSGATLRDNGSTGGSNRFRKLVTVNAGAAFDMSSNASATFFEGGITNNGTFNAQGSPTITFDGSTPQTITANQIVNFGATVGRNLNILQDVTVNGTSYFTAPIINILQGTLTVNTTLNQIKQIIIDTDNGGRLVPNVANAVQIVP